MWLAGLALLSSAGSAWACGHCLEDRIASVYDHSLVERSQRQGRKIMYLRWDGPMVILSASGMATGGRVLHHLANYVGDHRNMVVLTGYQSPGTRGATLASGSPTIRMHGKDLPVQAEIVQLASTSAHADAGQLLAWLGRMPAPASQVYVVHGESQASDALRQRIERELHLRVVVPEHGSVWPA